MLPVHHHLAGHLEPHLARAEVKIAFSLVGLLSVFVGWMAVGSFAFPEWTGLGWMPLTVRLGVLLLMLCAMGWNLVLGLWLQRGLRHGRLPPWPLKWFAMTLEALLPTLVLVVTATVMEPETAMSAPFLPVYGIPLALGALRLNPLLCVYGGAVASLSCVGVGRIITAGVTGPPGAWGTHIIRGLAIFGVGLAAALVARVLREGFVRTLDAVEDRNRVVGVFGRYLSDDVVETLLHRPGGLELGGRKQPVTVLMTDLRGFSTLASELPAEDVVRLLNHYLGAMTDVILDHSGTIDEFIGDAILVVFNAPLDQPDHARRALACAVAMQEAMVAVNAWNRERSLPELEMGVGVHTGTAVVGNIGSEKRQKYGVVGTTVNLTARVEGLTVGGQVLASAACVSAAGPAVRSEAFRLVHPKGAREPLEVRSVTGVGGHELVDVSPAVCAVRPRHVEVFRIAGKQRVPGALTARLVALSTHEAELEGLADRLEPGHDVVLHPGGGAAFARVVAVADGRVRLRFSARDRAAAAWLTAVPLQPT